MTARDSIWPFVSGAVMPWWARLIRPAHYRGGFACRDGYSESWTDDQTMAIGIENSWLDEDENSE